MIRQGENRILKEQNGQKIEVYLVFDFGDLAKDEPDSVCNGCPCNLNTVNIIHRIRFVKLYFEERVDFWGFGAIRAKKG